MKRKALAILLAVALIGAATPIPASAEALPVERFEAEEFDDWYDATEEDLADTDFPTSAGRDPLKTENGGTGVQVAGTGHKNWLLYTGMDFGEGYNRFYANYSAKAERCSSQARLEVRLDDVDSAAVCVLETPATNQSNWDNYATHAVTLDTPITGIHDVYIYMLGEPEDAGDHTCIGNFDYFGFEKVEAESVSVTPATLTLEAGKSATLTASVLPENTIDKTVSWSSSASSIAAVADGVVTAYQAGAAVITATTANGRTAECAVTVTASATQDTPTGDTGNTGTTGGDKPSTPNVAAPKNGTANVGGKLTLYKNGAKVTGTVIVKVGKASYAVKGGVVQAASKKAGLKVVKLGKKSYVVNAKGVVQKKKMLKVGKRRYVVNASGVIQKAKKKFAAAKVGKKTYIVNKKGFVQMKKKTYKVGKASYKVGKNGVAKKK